MVDLRKKPYCLSDVDIEWVEKTIASMTDEEKIGQLFFQLTAGQSEEYLRELMEKYHLGGCRYNAMPGVWFLSRTELFRNMPKFPFSSLVTPKRAATEFVLTVLLSARE